MTAGKMTAGGMMDRDDLFAGARILVVDDEAIQRALTRDSLEEAAFAVDEATNGDDAIRLAKTLRPDLMLLDVVMPGLNGFEVCRRLRADPETARLPIVIVTGREQSKDIGEGMAAGASDFLTKPLVWNLLPNRVRYVLRTSRLEAELRRSRDIAERALVAKSAQFAAMSHELRTPLNAIIGFSGLMERGDLGPLGAPEYRQFAADIHASGKQLLDAINALLEINRVEAGTVQISARRRRLNAIVAEAIAKARRTCEDPNGVTFKTITAADDYEVEVDPERFADSLAHVIANAIKFNKAGGGVSIETNRRPDGGLAIHVVDTGIGIAAKDIERAMEPFEQADNCLSRNFAGLGLPLARSLVRLHGGELTLESTLDVGSTVVVTLPRERLTRYPDA